MSGAEFVPLSLPPLLIGMLVAVACALPGNFLVLRKQALIGDAISHVRQEMTEKNRLDRKYTFSGSVLFERMKEKDLYTTDITAIKKRVARTGLANLFSR